MSLNGILRHLVLPFLCFPTAQALEIREFDPARHNRFLNFTTNPSHNPSFMHKDSDLTGVGWQATRLDRQLTMVSPLHFVGASHYQPNSGEIIQFLTSDNTLRQYTVGIKHIITNDQGNSSDLFIGRFSSPIPATDHIQFHPYLNLRNDNAYTGKSVIFLGSNRPGPQNPRGAGGSIAAITTPTTTTTPSGLNPTRCLTINYTNSSFFGDDDDAYAVPGDSGSPVFVLEGGKAAIVGTNSFVVTSSFNKITHSNFIPYYVDKLNAVMELDGYRMTKAIPGSTTLNLTHNPPDSVIRAGHSFNISLNFDNTGGTMSENVKLQNTFTVNANVANASGTSWHDESTATGTNARRAKIDSGDDTDYLLTLSIATPGMHTHIVTYHSDQSGAITENFTLNVIESFSSWTAALIDQTTTGDDDLDGVSNLLEYAFGGDPATPSRKVSGEITSLLPEVSRSGMAQIFTYVRRKDFAQRALSYSLTSSTTLQTGSFTDASAMISNTQTTSINDDLELVTLTLTGTGTDRFFRIEVQLEESSQ